MSMSRRAARWRRSSAGPRRRRSRRARSRPDARVSAASDARRARDGAFDARCCCRTRSARRWSRGAPRIAERWGYATDWRGWLLTRRVARPARSRAPGRLLPAAQRGARRSDRPARRRACSAPPTPLARRTRAARDAGWDGATPLVGVRAGRGIRRREAVAAGPCRRAGRRASRAAALSVLVGAAADRGTAARRDGAAAAPGGRGRDQTSSAAPTSPRSSACSGLRGMRVERLGRDAPRRRRSACRVTAIFGPTDERGDLAPAAAPPA